MSLELLGRIHTMMLPLMTAASTTAMAMVAMAVVAMMGMMMGILVCFSLCIFCSHYNITFLVLFRF